MDTLVQNNDDVVNAVLDTDGLLVSESDLNEWEGVCDAWQAYEDEVRQMQFAMSVYNY